MRPPFSSIFCWGTCVFVDPSRQSYSGVAAAAWRLFGRRGGGVGAVLASRRRREGGSLKYPAEKSPAVLADLIDTGARDVGLVDGLRRRRESALLARERAQARNRAAEDHCDVLAHRPLARDRTAAEACRARCAEAERVPSARF